MRGINKFKLWKGEYLLHKAIVEEYVPEKPGVYKIYLAENSKYRWINTGNNWRLMNRYKFPIIARLLGNRLTYIGQTNNLKRRLLDHIYGSNTNNCIKTLLKLGVPLTFKFREVNKPILGEKINLLIFCIETELCPPCDCNSPQCRNLGYQGGALIDGYRPC